MMKVGKIFCFRLNSYIPETFSVFKKNRKSDESWDICSRYRDYHNPGSFAPLAVISKSMFGKR
jgi:hypothetical protein